MFSWRKKSPASNQTVQSRSFFRPRLRVLFLALNMEMTDPAVSIDRPGYISCQMLIASTVSLGNSEYLIGSDTHWFQLERLQQELRGFKIDTCTANPMLCSKFWPANPVGDLQSTAEPRQTSPGARQTCGKLRRVESSISRRRRDQSDSPQDKHLEVG